MTVPIRRGAVYWIPDSSVNLPPTTAKDRMGQHPRRPFLVISNNERNTDDTWPVVIGFPLTTSDEFRTEYDHEIPAGEGGLPETCNVRVVMLQPIAKEKLREWIGQLPANTVDAIVSRMLSYMDVI